MKTNQKPFGKAADLFIKKEGFLHVAFWVICFGLNIVRSGILFDDYEYAFKSNLVEFPIHIFLVYLNIYYLLPKFIPEKPFSYSGILFIAMLTMSLLRIELSYQFVSQDTGMEIPGVASKYNLSYIVEVFISELYVVGIITAVKLIIDNARNNQINKELKMRNYETEIELLKSQFQPHFFLNTLNNLYALTLDKSEKAPDLIVKLGDMMKYLIYQSKKDNVPIIEEVTLIENFLELEKLRYGDRLKININLSGGITCKKIPPLILFPFVECTFKNETSKNMGEIDISFGLDVEDGYMTFFMKNKKCTGLDNKELRKILDLNKNGLRNTKRRLDLLYKNNYDLNISDSNNFYVLTLKIPVSQ